LFLNGLTPEEFFEELNDSYYKYKEINPKDIITSYQLPTFHKDPFDRFLIWESIRNDFVLLSVDSLFEPYIKYGLKVEN
jgi:PIN domain nuclease of toxin-antitoxin system